MSRFSVDQIRNIVLVGHGAAGKTSLADQLLFRSGITTRVGSVDDGTSQLDVDDEERQRHFTISAAMVHFEHAGTRINLIDTPGYPDFVGQAISALCAAETAVIVINASAGIEANTRRTFDLAGKAELARLIVLNKLDHENLDFAGLVASVQAAFGSRCVPLQLPDAVGPDFSRVVELFEEPVRDAPTVVAAGPVRTALLEAIVEADDELMERYLEGQPLTVDEVRAGAAKAVAAGAWIPILCTSAKTGVGVPELATTLVDLGLSPGEVVRHARTESGTDCAVRSEPEAPLVARVFKTRIDPFVSKLSYLRIFSGSLTKDATVRDLRTGRTIKLHQLLDVQGGQLESIDEAHAGDVVAVAKIDELQVGDTLVSNGTAYHLPALHFPTPMIGWAVEPKSRGDQQKISGALHKIEEEDPTFRVTRDPQTHELVMHGLSDLHLQVVQDRLHRREKVDIVTHPPKVPYRETILSESSGSYRHKKQSGGAGQFAEVHLRIAPLPAGVDPLTYFTRDQFPGLRDYHFDRRLNFAFVDCVSGGSVPNQYIPAVEKGVREAMERGVLAGCPMQDLAVALFFGKDHPVDSNEAAFRTAAALCFRQIVREAQPVLLEPIMHLSITIPAEGLGDLSSDLSSRRGRVEGLESLPGGWQLVQARAPLAELSTYARTLSSLTGGQGSFDMEFSHHEMVPPNEQHKLVAGAAAVTTEN